MAETPCTNDPSRTLMPSRYHGTGSVGATEQSTAAVSRSLFISIHPILAYIAPDSNCIYDGPEEECFPAHLPASRCILASNDIQDLQFSCAPPIRSIGLLNFDLLLPAGHAKSPSDDPRETRC